MLIFHLGKMRDKGTPVDNLCKFDGTKERNRYSLINAAALAGRRLLFATKGAMVKLVPGEEFETNNRMVAATKLAGRRSWLLSIQLMDGRPEAVLQTDQMAYSSALMLEEISTLRRRIPRASGELSWAAERATGDRFTCWVQTCRQYRYVQRKTGASEPSEDQAKRDGKGSRSAALINRLGRVCAPMPKSGMM